MYYFISVRIGVVVIALCCSFSIRVYNNAHKGSPTKYSSCSLDILFIFKHSCCGTHTHTYKSNSSVHPSDHGWLCSEKYFSRASNPSKPLSWSWWPWWQSPWIQLPKQPFLPWSCRHWIPTPRPKSRRHHEPNIPTCQ